MPIETAAAVERLLQGRLQPSLTRPLSEDSPEFTLAEGYAVQMSLLAAIEARGARVVGWKVGFTGAALQERYGVTEPVFGFLLDNGVFPTGAAVPVARFAGLAVEAEVAFLMRADLAGPGVSAPRALAAVEGAVPALELIDFRHSGAPRGADVVADGVYTNAIVLGGSLTPVAGLDLALEGAVYEHNGQVVGTHTCAEVLGNPLNSLAWLANALGRVGRGLRSGDVVLTGSISKVVRAQAGDTMRASFTRLGTVACRFV